MEPGEAGLTGQRNLLMDTVKYRSEQDSATTQHQAVEAKLALELVLRPERSMSTALITKFGPNSNLTWK